VGFDLGFENGKVGAVSDEFEFQREGADVEKALSPPDN